MSPSAKADHLHDKLISRGGVDPESFGDENAFEALPSLSKRKCSTTTIDLRSSFIRGLVCMPYSDNYNNRTHIYIYDWCVVWLDLRTITQQDMCFKEIGLHAQDLSTIVNLIISIIGGT